jgi:hypothetical protein
VVVVVQMTLALLLLGALQVVVWTLQVASTVCLQLRPLCLWRLQQQGRCGGGHTLLLLPPPLLMLLLLMLLQTLQGVHGLRECCGRFCCHAQQHCCRCLLLQQHWRWQ